MTLNIIYDERNYERYDPLMQTLSEQGITDFVLHPATVDVSSVVRSINLSHKKIVQQAKDSGLKECIIGEDDLMFTRPGAWQYFLDNKPKTFDIYLWGTYVMPLEQKIICGFQLYIVHESFYDKFLSVNENLHIDSGISDMGGNFKFCYPFPALQRPSFSRNNSSVVDYNVILDKKDIY